MTKKRKFKVVSTQKGTWKSPTNLTPIIKPRQSVSESVAIGIVKMMSFPERYGMTVAGVAKTLPSTEPQREDVIPLKDGRTLFKTNNGFKWWVESKKGVVEEVTEAYFNQCKVHRVRYIG